MSYRLKAAIAAAMVIVATPAFAQDSATANSSTTIIVPIEIENTAALSFGTIARPLTTAGTGTVTIDPTTGARTKSGDVALVSGGTIGRAVFSVTGDGARAYTATIPTSFVLSNGTTANDITVTLSSSLGSTGAVSTALTAGAATIGVGGEFTITGATPADEYTGSFIVSVAYN